MRIRVLVRVSTVLATAATAAVITVSSSSQASATTGPDLSMTGSVVSGVKSVEGGTGQQLAMSFVVKNNSSSQSADISFNFTFGHANVQGYICPLVSNHFDINPDGSSCEPGTLGAGKSSGASVIVVAPSGVSSTSVKACAQNLSGAIDPVSSNNCKTLTVAVVV